MRIDIPGAAWVRTLGRPDPNILLGVVTHDILVPELTGSFRKLAVLNDGGSVYTIRGEDPDKALYLQVASDLVENDHVRFEVGALDNALSSERSRKLLRRTVWDRRYQFDERWNKKMCVELRPFDAMRLRDRYKDDFQIDLQLPWLDDLVVIEGLLHRRIEQPLIVVGNFYGGWDIIFGWNERPEGCLLCYSISEIGLAKKAVRKICKEEGNEYDNTLRKLIRSSELEDDAIAYRYALYCERFCHTLNQMRGWTVEGAMEFAQQLSDEDRAFLRRLASVAELRAGNLADFDFVQIGSELLDIDATNPLAAMHKWPPFGILTDILRKEGPPTICIDDMITTNF